MSCSITNSNGMDGYWIADPGGTTLQKNRAIVIDSSDNVYLCGDIGAGLYESAGQFDFATGNGKANGQMVWHSGSLDAFVAK
jgi:hypothetical protein